MNNLKKQLAYKVFLILIIVLASVLRLWQIGGVPLSPDWDEAALGYNAYAILQTGRDEYGNFLPVVLRSFDDYKPALYSYLSIPFIKIMGLNLIAVRLPAVLIGITAVWLVYLLTSELTKRRGIALLTALLLAISPWHIQFSRTAFEASVAVFFNMLTLYFFLRAFKNPRYLIGVAIASGLSIYVYQSEKVFTPLLLALLLIIFFHEVKKIALKYILLAVIVGMIIILPMLVYIMTNTEALSRASNTVVFADEKAFLKENVKRQSLDREKNDWLGQVVDNRRLVYVQAIAEGYLAHFDLNWLFISGDAKRHHAPGMGLLYLFELPLLLLGIYYCIFDKKLSKKVKFIIMGWILLTPIPASVGSDFPHAVRTMNFLPMLQLLTVFGIIQLLEILGYIRSKRLRVSMIGLLVCICALNVAYFLNQYFIQLNYFYAKDWQYGYQEMISQVKKIEKNYTKIIVSEKRPMDQSYIFTLFYLKYPPEKFQQSMRDAVSRNYLHRRFGKYEMRSIEWNSDQYTKESLFIGVPVEFPEGIKTRYTITYPDGDVVMKLVDPSDMQKDE